MAPSARSIITQALMEIGAVGQGETPSAADAALGLSRLQAQLDAWQAESMTLYTFTRVTYTWPPSTGTATIGPGGMITTPLNPIAVNGVAYLVPGASPVVEVPMGQMDDDAYQALSIKTLTSTLPTHWWFNLGTDMGTLRIWPVPTGGVQLAIYCYFGVSAPTGLDDTVSGPPGYLEAFTYNLALRLMTPFGRRPEQVPLLVGTDGFAAQSLARIKRMNTEVSVLDMDVALTHGSGGYNVLSDGYSRGTS